jgi:hypothetical protein
MAAPGKPFPITPNEADLIFYQFNRSKEEPGDFSHFRHPSIACECHL